jgi:solute carrier family 13 (sodium-dependent dicarboxylate transporter), member 2/3/5
MTELNATSPHSPPGNSDSFSQTLSTLALYLGPLVCFACLWNPFPLISDQALAVVGLAFWVILWWVSDAVPIGATSLLPLIYLSGSGIMPITQACTPYASKIVFLFLGGFMLAIALEKWNLHKRVALKILSWTGTKADRIILGFMLATALLSMWMSNTASTLMMLPIAHSVLKLLRQAPKQDLMTDSNDDIHLIPSESSQSNQSSQSSKSHRARPEAFAIALMLGVAYAANLGGTMTLIGTPPNLVLASFLEESLQRPISFIDWMKVGVPFACVALVFTYHVLTRILYPNYLGEIKGAHQLIQVERDKLGTMSEVEFKVAFVFIGTALAWVFRGQLNQLSAFQHLSDTTIGLIGALLLFMISDRQGRRLLTWHDMQKLPWDIILLFGGGLCLASALQKVGLMQAIGDQFGHMTLSWSGIFMLTLVALSLTEVMSNVALVSVFIPVVSALATGINVDPLLLCIPVTLAASCAFMLPMSTPPNAIVFASGEMKMKHMIKAGLLLNILSVVWISTLSQFL